MPAVRADSRPARSRLRRPRVPGRRRLAALAAAHRCAGTAEPGATYYNVQVFRGRRRVLNAWSSRHARCGCPRASCARAAPTSGSSGRPPALAVPPATRRRSAARPSPSRCGRASSSTAPAHRRGAVAEVRPHIPFGTLRLRAARGVSPRACRGRSPSTRRGRFALPISTRAAERLGARPHGPRPDPAGRPARARAVSPGAPTDGTHRRARSQRRRRPAASGRGGPHLNDERTTRAIHAHDSAGCVAAPLAATAAAGAAVLVAPPFGGASSHREAPSISQDPTADNTDVYAFRSPDAPDTATLIANFDPVRGAGRRAELLPLLATT